MKHYIFLPFLAFALLLASYPSPVLAQTDSPPEDSGTGIVLGKIINQNKGNLVTGSLDVMLHIWDQGYVDLGMEHGKSEADGTFKFSSVSFDPERLYAVMTTFENVAYYSDVMPGPADSDELELTVPVIETTSDLTSVQIDQMHLLFDFAEDGMETTEIYVLSNLGERTVKDAVTLEDGQAATLRFPLPADANFIFFQPDGQDRFVKFPGGFADAYPLLPGESSGQFMVQYLVPFSSGRTYTYIAPINAQAINFLLPADAGVTLEGKGLSGPQPYTLENGSSYRFYSYGSLGAGETIKVSFKGQPKVVSSKAANNPTLPLAVGGVILGLTMAGVGVWWWRRPDEQEIADVGNETADIRSENYTFDNIITEIVRLDEANEQGLINKEEHRRQRRDLLLEAKKIFPDEFRQS
jgi:hypothetical protein